MYCLGLFIDYYIRIHSLRIDYLGFKKRVINKSLMTRQLILTTRGSQKITPSELHHVPSDSYGTMCKVRGFCAPAWSLGAPT